MTLHREGKATIAISTVLFLILSFVLYYFLFQKVPVIFWILELALVVVYGLIISFFRIPERRYTVDPQAVTAPCDGKVVVIEEVEADEYFKDRRIQVSIFMSPLNVHVNRNPVDGEIVYDQYHKGKYLVAWHPKSSTENERTTVVIETANGVQVLLRQIAGAVARRIIWYVKEGQPVKQGEEFGFIKFGSRVDVFLPLDADIKVAIGDVTRGGVTVLAELK